MVVAINAPKPPDIPHQLDLRERTFGRAFKWVATLKGVSLSVEILL